MGKKPAKCPACGSTGSVIGPEPFRCLDCGYVVTPTEEANDG